MIEKYCIECSSKFLVKKYRQETAKFCSVKCRAKYSRGKIKKEKVSGNGGYRKTKIDGVSILSHRYVFSELLGRELNKGEVVHHKNGDKADNRVENLMVMTQKEHSAHHNQKYPTVKSCLVCRKEFTPHPTKRKRAKTCSKECFKLLQSLILRNPDAPNSMYRDKAYRSQKKKQIAVIPQVAYQIFQSIAATAAGERQENGYKTL